MFQYWWQDLRYLKVENKLLNLRNNHNENIKENIISNDVLNDTLWLN